MSRYQEVRKTLYAEIEAGAYEDGARFPTDQELCKRFGVSRHTVREAIRELQDRGLLERRRGVGTIVAGRAVQTRFVHEVNSVDEVLAYGSDGYFECHYQGRVVAHEGLAQFIGCEAGQSWYRFAGLRRARDNDLILAWTEIYVHVDYADVSRDIADRRLSVIEAICERYRVQVGQIQQEISAQLIDADTAAVLGVAAGEAALGITRRYFDTNGRLFEAAASVIPADRYTFRSDVRRQSGFQGESK